MIDYTNYDYQALVDRMTELLQDKEGWGDGFESSTGQALIQLMADINDNLFFMLERRSQEAFIDTALLDSSIRARASELGYRPRRKVSSTGTLQLDLVDEDGNLINALGNVFVEKGTIVTQGSNSFVTTEDIVIPTGSSSATVAVKEGTPNSAQFNFDTEPYLSSPTAVIEDYENIEEFSLEVTDANGIYSDIASPDSGSVNVTSLSYALPNDTLYDIRFSKEGMRIVFGDDEFGKKPEGVVVVNWVESSGDEVNVVSTGLDFELDEEFLTDDRNVTPQELYRYSLTNITPIRGGQDEETSQEIATNAPQFSRTANRAVTADDHEFWVLRSGIGDIVDVNVYGEQETGSLIYNMNNVYVSYVTSDQLELNVEQQSQLSDFMDRYKMVTTHLVFDNATQIQIVLDIDFKRHPQLPITNEQLYTVVKEYVDDYFEITRGSIGGELQHSELVRYLQNRTYTFNGVVYPITDFVKVEIVAQYPIEIPLPIYDVLIYIDDSYTFVDGDTWTIVIDGQSISVSVQSGDTKPILVERMRQEIFDNTEFLTAAELDTGDNELDGGSILRIKSPYVDDTFSLDLTQGDLSTFVTSDNVFPIPTPEFTNPGGDDLFVRGSVHIVDENEVELFRDDGNGTMVPASGVSDPSFGIDYVQGQLLSPSISTNGTYYVRYQQNEFQNYKADDGSVLVLSPLADGISDPFLFSKLNIIQ